LLMLTLMEKGMMYIYREKNCKHQPPPPMPFPHAIHHHDQLL